MSKCDFCGEKEGTELISNPNFDSDDVWKVCKDCKKHIKNMQMKAGEIWLKQMIKDLKKKKELKK